MDRKTFWIVTLLISAAVLLVANFRVPQSAQAIMAMRDRDYQIATGQISTGGDAVYVIDNRTGLVAVFSFDLATRTLVPRAVRPVADAFPMR